MTVRVLVAPDSFKGSLTSVEVAQAIGSGWRRARPDDEVALAPMADGGEGTIEAIRAADSRWNRLPASSRDPIGRPYAAHFLRDGDRGVVELADASGLSRLTTGERDPLGASTFGTGLTLAAAIGLGVRSIVLGIGGSATTDGGAGILVALGARLLDAAGQDLPPGGGALARLARVDLRGLSPVLHDVHLTIASDVTNPLLGELGAAAVYGPQKGATEAQVRRLDAALTHYADVLEAACGSSVRGVSGAGAAGGTLAGLLAIADRLGSLEVRPGVQVVMELTGFAGRVEAADVVITGEGRVDAQTAHGKTAMGVARRAAAAGVPCVALGGGVQPEGIDALAGAGAITLPVAEGPGTVEAAMAAGAAPIERASERLARLVSLGALLGGRERAAT